MSEDVKSLLSQLTLEEKAQLCCGENFWNLKGIERLGLPSIMVTDGPNGLRKQDTESDHLGIMASLPATCFPSAVSLASTWNLDLLEEVGQALGRECRREKISVLLGPGVDIKRHPCGGRNFEYYSEDPLLSGKMATAWVKGVQSQGVGTSLKHFAVNNHESSRMVVDVIVDERTLREIYLPSYEIPVSEVQPWTIMCSYNKLNGSYLSDSYDMLTGVLRQDWGFDGLVVSDWGATNDRVISIKSGLNLEMPSSGDVHTQNIMTALEEGSLTEAELDRSLAPVLSLMMKAKPALTETIDCSFDEHHQLAQRAAEEACVLLQNRDSLLPLKPSTTLAVIGALAKDTRFQGNGSSKVNPTKVTQPLAEISAMVTGKVSYAAGYPMSGSADPSLIDEAFKLAEDCERIVLVVGLTPDFESEGFDREHMNLPESQLVLIKALAPFYHKLIMVLQNGAPVALPFADQVPAILEAYLGGQAGATALARVLFGEVNPSGKLAETFPMVIDDVPSNDWFPGDIRQCQYREGIWVGYRYYDTARVPVAFPFGHGLSYTQFEYSSLCVNGQATADASEKNNVLHFSMQGEQEITVEVTVTNTGDCAGAEVVQLYVGQKNSSVPRPAKELKNFSKVFLQPNESKKVTMSLNRRAFSWWQTELHQWVVESDAFDVSVGSSSTDIRLQETITLQGDQDVGVRNLAISTYFQPQNKSFDRESFVALLGHDIPKPVVSKPYHLNSTLGEVQDTRLGRFLFKMMLKMTKKLVGELNETESKVLVSVLSDMPLRNLVTQSQGKFPPGVLRGMIHIMNGDWRGLFAGKLLEYR